jgi:hypothetical protein
MGGRKTKILGSGMLRVARRTKRFAQAKRRAKSRRQVFEDASKRLDDAPDTSSPSAARRLKDEATEAKTVVRPRKLSKARSLRMPAQWFDRYCRAIWDKAHELGEFSQAYRSLDGGALTNETERILFNWAERRGVTIDYVPMKKIRNWQKGNRAQLDGKHMKIAEEVVTEPKTYLREVAHEVAFDATGQIRKFEFMGPKDAVAVSALNMMDFAIEEGMNAVMTRWWSMLGG